MVVASLRVQSRPPNQRGKFTRRRLIFFFCNGAATSQARELAFIQPRTLHRVSRESRRVVGRLVSDRAFVQPANCPPPKLPPSHPSAGHQAAHDAAHQSGLTQLRVRACCVGHLLPSQTAQRTPSACTRPSVGANARDQHDSRGAANRRLRRLHTACSVPLEAVGVAAGWFQSTDDGTGRRPRGCQRWRLGPSPCRRIPHRVPEKRCRRLLSHSQIPAGCAKHG